jgi:hypothetical protein
MRNEERGIEEATDSPLVTRYSLLRLRKQQEERNNG